MLDESYLALVSREFERLKQLADRAIAQLSPEQFFAPPGETDNSIALLVKHVAGNSLSRWTDFLTTDGEKPHRDRDSEFVLFPKDTREHLLARWDKGWAALFDALRPLKPENLSQIVTIRGEPLTVLQAINRQLTHYAYHIGQIVYVAKQHCGPAWRTLSIPRGGSAQFNQQPRHYLDHGGNASPSM